MFYTKQLSKEGDSIYQRIVRGEPMLAMCGIALLILLCPLSLAYLMETRTTLDINVWTKPLKFTLSLAVYTLSLSFFSHFLKLTLRSNFLYLAFIRIVIVAIFLEMIWLIYAASIAEPSHFNNNHDVLTTVYPIMGILATVLTLQSFVTGLGVLKNPDNELNPLLRYTIGYSLVITCILTLATAYPLAGAEEQAHARIPTGSPELNIHLTSDNQSLPLLGWLSEVGDLRVAHFFSTHAMHFLPFIAWLITVSVGRAITSHAIRAKVISLGLVLSYSVFVGFVYIQASQGMPFLRI